MTLLRTPATAPGTVAPDFTLPATDGRTYRLADYTGRALVVVFTCNHCPYAQAVWPRLIQLAAEYLPHGINFAAINPNDDRSYPGDSFENMKVKVKEWGINFPYLRDESQAVAKAYGAVCTPDIFVYEAKRRLVYRGRFDDNWQDVRQVTRRDLQEVLEAVVAGRPVLATQHPSMGCSIKWREGEGG